MESELFGVQDHKRALTKKKYTSQTNLQKIHPECNRPRTRTMDHSKVKSGTKTLDDEKDKYIDVLIIEIKELQGTIRTYQKDNEKLTESLYTANILTSKMNVRVT